MSKKTQAVLNLAYVTVGILLAGLGLEGFLIPNRFIDGGVTGISMLISEITGIRLAIFIALINVPFIVLGHFQVGKAFAVRNTLTILGLAICLSSVHFPVVTHDKLLAAVFGGGFLGAGIGLSIRGHSVLDGTEVLALLLSKKFGATVGEIILFFNIVIFSVAAVVLGVEIALYSMLTYFAASKTVDFLIYGIEEYIGVVIVSPFYEQINALILNELGRGVTIYKGEGGYSASAQQVLFCVITRLELPKIRNLIESQDSSAFVVLHPVNEVFGGVVKKRAVH